MNKRPAREPRVVRIDWDAFEARLARLRLEHTTRTPAAGLAASLSAFRRWGVPPPKSFVDEFNAATVAAGRWYAKRATQGETT